MKKYLSTPFQIKRPISMRRARRLFRINRLLSRSYVQFFLAILIFLGIFAVKINSFKEMAGFTIQFNLISYISAFIFTIEFCLRLYISPVAYRAKSPFSSVSKYLTSFIGVIDFVSVLPFVIPYFFGSNHYVTVVFEIARNMIILKLFRYSKSYETIRQVIDSVKSELVVSFSMMAIFVSICANLMYYFERAAQPDKFENIGDGVWWAIISFTTVGYGDVYPITPLGKFLAASTAIMGLIIFSLPTAIVTGAFMTKLQEQKAAQRKH